MQIKKITEKITTSFNREKTVQNHSNPFGVSFKGNIISADVFESTEKKVSFGQNLTNRSRMALNAMVGSINSFSEGISSRFNSIVSFGARIKENARNAIRFLNESKIVMNIGNNQPLLALDLPTNPYRVENLLKRDVLELKDELIQSIDLKRGIING